MATINFTMVLYHDYTIDCYNGQPVIFDDHADWVTSVTFSSDNKILIVGCKNNVIKYYPIELSAMERGLCDKISRDMTQEEWTQFIGKDETVSKKPVCP